MRKTIQLIALYVCGLTASLVAQTGVPVWNLPFTPSSSVHVDLDAYTYAPYGRQVLFSEVSSGDGLEIAAAASGTAHHFPTLNLNGPCSDVFDSLPPCKPKSLILDHGNGFHTVYAGLDPAYETVYGISEGEFVSAGQALGMASIGGTTGLRKLHFEVIVPLHWDSLVTPDDVLIRNIITVRSRTGSYQYDAQNVIPVFQVGAVQRQVVAGEVITLSGGTGGTGKIGNAMTTPIILAPNPSNGHSRLQLDLPEAARVTMTIHTLQGGLVATPLDERLIEAGFHDLPINLVHLPAGLYLYTATAGRHHHTGKLVITH